MITGTALLQFGSAPSVCDTANPTTTPFGCFCGTIFWWLHCLLYRYLAGSMKNFLANVDLSNGMVKGCLTPDGATPTIYHAKPVWSVANASHWCRSTLTDAIVNCGLCDSTPYRSSSRVLGSPLALPEITSSLRCSKSKWKASISPSLTLSLLASLWLAASEYRASISSAHVNLLQCRYWNTVAQDDTTGLFRWHDQLESGCDNLITSTCPSILGTGGADCWVQVLACDSNL